MLSTLEYRDARPLQIERFARVLSTSYTVPETVVTNEDIIKRFDLIATDRAVQFAIGIKERRFADEETMVSDLLYTTAKKCLDDAGVEPEKIDRVLYTKLMGDHIVPATSIQVLKKLGINRGVPAFDILASTRLASTKSKKDTRTIFLQGDAVVGMLLGKSDVQHFLASYLYTDNTYFDYSYIPFGTELLNNSKSFDNEMFNMQMPDGMVVHESVIDSCEIVTQRLLHQTGMALDDIDVFITCDQTTMTWDAQLARMGVPKEKSTSIACSASTGTRWLP
jgi:3-oxoacyl-[acyl-carrier-protein] synthase-3